MHLHGIGFLVEPLTSRCRPAWLVLFRFLGKDLAGEIGRGEEKKKKLADSLLFSLPLLGYSDPV